MVYLKISIILFIIITIFIKFNNKKEKFENNYKYTAVIVEPREHKALDFVLQNFNDNLSVEWQFIVFHGNKNKEYTEKICKRIFIPERIKLENLNVDNLTITEYNKLLYSEEFYNKIPTETFLIFQTDTIICSKHKELINKFLDYDYVGAPWINKNVGNGGLSLRKKSKMLEILNNCNHDDNTNEDIFFSESCDKVTINKPTYDDAKLFSIETVNSDKSFGIHKAYNYLDINTINGWCPEINILNELNI